jgi:hypothetical protein
MSARAQQLLALFEGLATDDQATLLAFAEFLAARPGAVPPLTVTRTIEPLPEPEAIERPSVESIIAGLKRLSKTYPMLDKSEMLSATSDIVSSHILHGSDAAQAIDELEEIFAAHYRQLVDGRRGE